jgi:hypothetical protein
VLKRVRQVVKRKNLDIVLRAREQNKALADVYLSRSEGKSKAPPGQRTPHQKRIERKFRKHAQQVADNYLDIVFQQDLYESRPAPGAQLVRQEASKAGSDKKTKTVVTHLSATREMVDLETWAKKSARAVSTFGSSEHRQPAPQITKVEPSDGGGDGYYLSFTTLAKLQTDATFKPSVTGPACTHGKALGGRCVSLCLCVSLCACVRFIVSVPVLGLAGEILYLTAGASALGTCGRTGP